MMGTYMRRFGKRMGCQKKCIRSTDSGRGSDEKISSDKNIRK